MKQAAGLVLGHGFTEHRGRRDTGCRGWLCGIGDVPGLGYFSAQKFPSHTSVQRNSPSHPVTAQTVSGWSTPPNSQGSPQSRPCSPRSQISAEMHPSYHLPPTPRRARPPSSGHPGHGQPAPFRRPARAVRNHRHCSPFDRLLRTSRGSSAYRTGQRIGTSFPSRPYFTDKATRAPNRANRRGRGIRLQTRACRHRISCLGRPSARDRIPPCVQRPWAIAVAMLTSNM